MVIDHGMRILISHFLFGSCLFPAQDPPSAPVRDSAQFLDVHMYQFTRAVPLIADRDPGGPVQVAGGGTVPDGRAPRRWSSAVHPAARPSDEGLPFR